MSIPSRSEIAPHLESKVSPVAPGNMLFGKPSAAIEIVEFADFQCPFCASASKQLGDLENMFPGLLGLSYRQFPLSGHKNARLAAAAALAAGRQGKFKEMHDIMYSQFRSLGYDDVIGYARLIGLDHKRFMRDLIRPETRERITADLSDGQKFGVSGTPTIFINGHKYVGAISTEALRKTIIAQHF